MPDGPRRHRRIFIQRDFGVRRNHLGNLAYRQCHSAVKIVGAQIRHHGPANIAEHAVGENALKPVADFNPALVVADGKKNQYSLVRALAPDLPLGFQFV